MATVYGGWVATDDFRAKLVYSTSSTNTATTISATLYIESNAGWSNYGSGSLTIKNGSTTIGSASGSNKAFSGGTTVQVCSKSVSVTRTHSAQTITISCSVGASYTSSTSSKSVTVTVSAKPSYTVTYNNNNGSGSPGNQTKWYGESLTLSSTKPTRTGYTFSKWNTKADGSGTSYASGGAYTANAALTLYAIWTANKYTISYNGNNSTGGSTSSQTKTYNVALTLRTNGFTRTGYTFSKWNTKADGTGTNYSAGGSYTANAATTLYAIWTIDTYTVTYNGNGGSGVPSNQKKTYGTTLPLSMIQPTRTGYTFSKWNTKADGTGTNYNPGANYTANAAVTLYAIWTIDTYAIAYNGNVDSEHINELSGSTESQTKTYGVALTLQDNGYSRTGYTFLHWNTLPDGSGSDYDAASEYTANAPITLYAIWRPDAPDVTIKQCYRSDSEGNPDDEGVYLYVEFRFVQTLSSQIQVRLYIDDVEKAVWSNAQSDVYPLSGTSYKLYDAQLSQDSAYEVKLQVSNDYGSTVVKTNLGTAYYPIDAKAGGTGIAFGKAATETGILDSNFPVKIRLKTTETGITILNPDILTSDATAPESIVNAKLLDAYDSNSDSRSRLDFISKTDNRQGIQLGTYRNINNEEVSNSLYLAIDSNGDKSIEVTDSAAFRNGLGASSGLWPESIGGTGQTSLQATRNAMGLGNTLGVLPAANGGTGHTSLQAARNAMGLGNTTGVLPIANGGTGLSASPSMLANLGSTTAANVLAASPRPGITGTLSISHGGTGKTTAADARKALGAAHNVWTSLGSVTGTSSLTLDLTDYNEVLITARYSSSYLSSIVLPKAGIHASTMWEIYLGGWGKNGTTSNRRAVAEISRVKFTPIAVTVDNVERTSSSTWVVYAR